MRRCLLQRQLDDIRARAEEAEQVVIDAARDKYVIPFCDRTGYRFVAGMGGWVFSKGQDDISEWNDERLPKRVRAVLQAETLNRAGDAGSMMQDYTPKGYKK